ncbi:MAG: ATP-dependent DNA helicase RecG, partial [Firmicutes bacterium]|nr:ATP-dependent DNA helicase RecG [Bacillota bacterium]
MSSKTPVIIKADSPVSDVKGVGPKKAAAFEKLGISYVKDAAVHFPRAYEDLRNAKSIAALQNEDKCLVRARVLLI